MDERRGSYAHLQAALLVDILLFPERRLLIMSKDLQNLKFRWKKCGSEMIFVVAQNCYCMARMEELSGVLGA